MLKYKRNFRGDKKKNGGFIYKHKYMCVYTAYMQTKYTSIDNLHSFLINYIPLILILKYILKNKVFYISKHLKVQGRKHLF